MEYRLAEMKDTPRLAEMRWDFKLEDLEVDDLSKKDSFIVHCDAFLQKALQNNWYCWVAAEDGFIVSHMYVERVDKIPEPREWIGSWGYLTNVYTVPKYRNTGIGASLMAKVKEWSKLQGFELLIVWPSDRSIPFYERAGFRDKSEIMELLF